MFTFQKNWSVGFESTLRADEDEDDRGQEATQHEERFVKVDWPARAQGSHGLMGSRKHLSNEQVSTLVSRNTDD